MKRFDKFIKKILGIEGGYSNHKNDRGGATKFGITERTARLNGYEGEMKDLPLETALSIYRLKYWEKNNISQLANDAIAFECLDNAVNMGTGRAVKLLQKAYNIVNYDNRYGKDLVVDGGLGPVSLVAINLHPAPERLLKLINCYQAMHYVSLAEKNSTQREFVWGWVSKRVEV